VSSHLCGGSWGLSGGVDIGAEESLAQDGDQAALGLLADLGASVDEAVDGGGSDGSCINVSEGRKIVLKKTYEERSRGWRGSRRR
jgi:hypothetical protein